MELFEQQSTLQMNKASEFHHLFVTAIVVISFVGGKKILHLTHLNLWDTLNLDFYQNVWFSEFSSIPFCHTDKNFMFVLLLWFYLVSQGTIFI